MAGSEAHEGIFLSASMKKHRQAEEGKIKIKKRKTDQLRLKARNDSIAYNIIITIIITIIIIITKIIITVVIIEQ